MADLWRWSATSLAAAIREKRVSSREVVQSHLDRIEAVNPKVNAVTVVLAEKALRAADGADRRIAAGESLPLLGVPITIKENIDLVGTATTHGVAALREAMPATDAPVVIHMKRAGAIPIGRTNMPDFGLRWHTDNALWGATRNPWDASLTPGGSSGGEAAALATGMSPLGIGNDVAGSLRYPAQCCGITAIRPSLGRLSRIETSIFPDPPMLYEQIASVNGPMARHIEDLRLALDVMSQPDPSDPWWTPAPRLGAAMAGPIRVALTTDPLGDGCAPRVAAGVREAAAALADAGYVIEEVDPPALEQSGEVIAQICDMEIEVHRPAMLPVMSADGRVALEAMIGDTTPDLAVYMAAIARRYQIAREWNLFMQRYPLVLGPVSTREPFEIGHDLIASRMERFTRSIALTEICNLLGLPSVAVPVQVAGGLPQAAQLIGPRFHEDLCFDAAEVIERRHGTFTPIEPREAA